MNILIYGAAGFIGTNLIIQLSKREDIMMTVVDSKIEYFNHIVDMKLPNVKIIQSDFCLNTDFFDLLKQQEVVYHLVSSTSPSTSNQQIADELMANVVSTARFLDACVKCGVKKVIFLSSGGTVYGQKTTFPIKEDDSANPINSYGLQKLTIENLLYLYWCMYGLDYRVIRLANPYGPYQRPNGLLGAVTTFVFNAINNKQIIVYGDGNVIRDYIYIDDAVEGIINIATGKRENKVYNLGCGYGTSINELLEKIQNVLGVSLNISYSASRKVDVPVNYLDVSRYNHDYGELNLTSIEEGILKTACFLQTYNYNF